MHAALVRLGVFQFTALHLQGLHLLFSASGAGLSKELILVVSLWLGFVKQCPGVSMQKAEAFPCWFWCGRCLLLLIGSQGYPKHGCTPSAWCLLRFPDEGMCTGLGTTENPASELSASVMRSPCLLWLAWSSVPWDFLYPDTAHPRLCPALM